MARLQSPAFTIFVHIDIVSVDSGVDIFKRACLMDRRRRHSAMLYWHFYSTLVNFARYYLSVDMCFCSGIPFTMYAVIVQSLRIYTFGMSAAVLQLVAGTFCYENVVRPA